MRHADARLSKSKSDDGSSKSMYAHRKGRILRLSQGTVSIPSTSRPRRPSAADRIGMSEDSDWEELGTRGLLQAAGIYSFGQIGGGPESLLKILEG